MGDGADRATEIAEVAETLRDISETLMHEQR